MLKRFDLQFFAESDSAASTAKDMTATAAIGTWGPAGAAGNDPKPAAGEPAGDKPKAEEPAAKYTDADLDRIIGQKFAEWQKK